MSEQAKAAAGAIFRRYVDTVAYDKSAKEGMIGVFAGIIDAEFAEVVTERDKLQQWVHDLQAGTYINCVYCGHRYGPDDEVPATMADVLKEHIEQCPKHPMSALKADLETMTETGIEYKDALRELAPAVRIAIVIMSGSPSNEAARVTLEQKLAAAEEKLKP
jgi:Zn ribbon nucleic-acid-binding protein